MEQIKKHGHVRRHKKKYLAGAAGAAALAAPFAFQRVRGAANLARKGFFTKGKLSMQGRAALGILGARRGWSGLKDSGRFLRTQEGKDLVRKSNADLKATGFAIKVGERVTKVQDKVNKIRTKVRDFYDAFKRMYKTGEPPIF